MKLHVWIALLLGPLALAESPTPPTSGEVTEKWCKELKAATRSMGWKLDPCGTGINWKFDSSSVEGRPLMYAEFGKADSKNTTLVFSMVHADEVTPLYLGIQLARWAAFYADSLQSSRVVIAPLVNPDGFFRSRRTRVNSRGVDVNRNFNTHDWHEHALVAWKKKFRSDPRRFPGHKPESEPETVFQRMLIEKFAPHKILSIHAPLNFMDYDGPSQLALEKFPQEYVQECIKLKKQLKARNGEFYPGSLGNFAGQDLGIPTLTLELASADTRKAKGYWHQFRAGIRTMIEYRIPDADWR